MIPGINLLINEFPYLVPPTQLLIVNDQGVAVTNTVIGPYKEGSSLNITCISSGGKYFNMVEFSE